MLAKIGAFFGTDHAPKESPGLRPPIAYRPPPAKHWAVEHTGAQYLGAGLRRRSTKKTPAARRPGKIQSNLIELEPIKDLIGPEPLEPVQRLVERGELFGIYAADLLNCAHVLLIK